MGVAANKVLDNLEKIYRCCFCDETFGENDEAFNHIANEHTEKVEP